MTFDDDILLRDEAMAVTAIHALDELMDDRRSAVREAAQATMLCLDNLPALSRLLAGTPAGGRVEAAIMGVYNATV